MAKKTSKSSSHNKSNGSGTKAHALKGEASLKKKTHKGAKTHDRSTAHLSRIHSDDTFATRKQTVLGFINDPAYHPMKAREIAVILQVPKEARGEYREILDSLEREGRIAISDSGKVSALKVKRYIGIFQGHPRGFGFVTPIGEDGQRLSVDAEGNPIEDVFISDRDNGGAMDSDQVEYIIKANPSGKRAEGKITKVLERGVTRIVGLYEKSENFGFVKPDNQRLTEDIYIRQGKDMDAVTGQKVVVELKDYNETSNKKVEGVIVEILGFANAPGTDILSIAVDFGIPTEFPEKVLNQAERVGKDVTEADIAGRMDLRDLMMVTIDGEDAKDLDDAVSLYKEGDNYMLGVHIADVANYVQENSALDREALKRGTSVYLVDRVIPMLPPKLSNGICSLNPKVDRLALSCLMKVSPQGVVLEHTIAETVIRTTERMTYTSVAKILEDDPEAEETTAEIAKYEELVPMFRQMHELSLIIRKRRHQRGSIDFDFPETKMQLDEEGNPIAIKAYEVNTATRLIEDFMLLANETVAEEFFWREIPFLYRSHETPEEEKMKGLALFINNFGYTMRVKEQVHPLEIQKLLAKIEGKPEEMLISRLALRSMKQARYTHECFGHFGLAAKYYSHFTSPIRRYPDLQIHRIIKETLRGRMSGDRIAHYEAILPDVAVQSSTMERRAEEAERETIKLKKAQFMQQHIGDTFTGIISSVTKWGLYIELPNTIEGMIHITKLTDDYYIYDDEHLELYGERTGRTYKLGQELEIEVEGVDLIRRTIDFSLISRNHQKKPHSDIDIS